jgi:hypothetical protein
MESVHRHGAPDRSGPSFHRSTTDILLREGVRYNLIGAIHQRSDDRGQAAAAGTAHMVAPWVARRC